MTAAPHADGGDLIHATCVVIDGMGVLIRGASGAGKSDLALRLIDRGAVLVGDDYLRVAACEARLTATVPATIAGRLEVRGVGIVAVPHRDAATIDVVVDLTSRPSVERMPEPCDTLIAGVTLPLYRVDPFPASAPIKVELLLKRLKDHV